MTHPDPAPGVNVPLLAAPCGCTYKGRFYSTRGCTKLGPDATGNQQMRHAMRVRPQARPVDDPTISDRGFKHMDPVLSRDSGFIQAYDSSLATSPHIRVRIQAPMLPARPEFHAGIPAGMVEAAVHLSLAAAARFRDQITYLIEHHYQQEITMTQPQPETETRWFDDPDQVHAFGGLLVAAGEFDTAQSLLDYIEKPWKWDRERDQWIAHGRPNAEDNPEQWQAFVELLA